MVKPHISIEAVSDEYLGKYGPTLKNISIYSIWNKGYVLAFRLETMVPHRIVSVSGSHMTHYELEHQSRWINRMAFLMKYNDKTLKSKSLNINNYGTVCETTEALRETFLDWIKTFQATVDNPMDVTRAVLKAVKWYDTWHNELIIKDIIE